ncbi:MAG: endonuclease domain-containing protein [Candidatus Bipolaricaulota bacterium]|nr:endonuclease domain-containing protein [Candidatus Bipolaricaulota bacterium]
MAKRVYWRGDPTIRLRARELRRETMPVESILWEYLRRRQLCGLKFRRQHPIGEFIVDFYCAEHKLIIELDGAIHEQQRERDQERTEILQRQGYRVLRIKNAEIEQDLEGVLQRITAACCDQ